MFKTWAALPRDTRLLLGARAARSIGQGALIVTFALYLRALDWSAPAIGALFTGGLLLDATLITLLGPLSDRVGRKRFLLVYEAAQAIAAVLALITSAPMLLAAAAVVGGFGRGANGSSGPFAPVELSWLTQTVAARERGPVFSLNMAVGFTGMGIGALLGGLPEVFDHMLEGALAYRPLFVLSLTGSVICFMLLALTPDRATPAPDTPQDREAAADDAAERRKENGMLLRLFGINALNGVGIGLIGPLMAYWFAVRFGQGPADIGPAMALAYGATAVSSVGAGRLVQRFGVIRAVVWMRTLAVLILVAMPLVPSFWMAATLHVVRSACNRGTAGARQALTVSLVRPHRRGAAVSTGSVAVQVPRAAGPLFAGLFFGSGMLAAPFYIAAGFFSAYILFYRRVFAAYDPTHASRERERG
jgi:MFS family permease